MAEGHSGGFRTHVLTGGELQGLAREAGAMRRRDCYGQLARFLEEGPDDRACALAGLRRTGKTIMLLQAACDFAGRGRGCAAYIMVLPGDGMDDLLCDLEVLRGLGVGCVLIDEAVRADGFAERASELAGGSAARGMKIVLAGAEPLALLLAVDGDMRGRMEVVRTSPVTLGDHAALFGGGDPGRYARCGGALLFSDGGEESPSGFNGTDDARRYVRATALGAENALRRFGLLGRLSGCECLSGQLESGELPDAIEGFATELAGERIAAVLVEGSDFACGAFAELAQAVREAAYPSDRVALDAAQEAGVGRLLEDVGLITRLPSGHLAFTQPGVCFQLARGILDQALRSPAFKVVSMRQRDLAAGEVLARLQAHLLEDAGLRCAAPEGDTT